MPTVTATGITDVQRRASALPDAVTDELSKVAISATARIQEKVATYPAQPPYMGMRNQGAGRNTYVRTGDYGKNVHASVTVRGPNVTGYIESGMPYSVWLRGYSDGSYLGAWMHRPFWESQDSILEVEMPLIEDETSERVIAVVKDVMGA